MTWAVEKAEQAGGLATITLKHLKPDSTDDVGQDGTLVTRTLRHERTSFPGSGLQTLAQWRVNIKREVAATIALWDAEEAVAAPPTDITAAVR